MGGSVSGAIDRRLVAVSPDASLGAARKLAKASRVSVLPVISDNRLVGVLDIEASLAGNDGDKVSSMMVKPVFVEANAKSDEARKLMIKHGLARIPVVDSAASMKCIGTVSSTDLI